MRLPLGLRGCSVTWAGLAVTPSLSGFFSRKTGMPVDQGPGEGTLGWPPPGITAPCPVRGLAVLGLTWRQAFTQRVKWRGSRSVAQSVVSDSATPWTAARQTSSPVTVTSRFLWTWKGGREDGARLGPPACRGYVSGSVLLSVRGWGPCPWESPAHIPTRPAHSQVHPASMGTTQAGWGLVGGAERAVGSGSAGAAGGCWRGEGRGLGPCSQPGKSLGASFSSPPGKPPNVAPGDRWGRMVLQVDR